MVTKKIRRLRWLLVVALCHSAITLAEVTVRVDRNPVHLNETFRITYEADFRFSTRPDLSPLTQELDVLGTSQGTNITIVNGRQAVVQSLTLDVIARKEGPLTIPSVEFDGQATEALTINVLPVAQGSATATGDAEDVFIEVSIEPDDGYVQSQYLYTLRVFHAPDLESATLTEPDVSGVDAVLERVGEDAYYKTQRNGRSYSVVERRYAVFPQSSGELVIEPLLFEATLVSQRRSMLDLYGRRGERVRLRSEQVQAGVQAVPDAFPGDQWLPARRLYLKEEWSGTTEDLPIGEPVTRTVSLVAEGLRASQLPDISPPAPDGIKQYPDQPVLDTSAGSHGMTGHRQEKIALIPSRPGQYEIPEVEVPWFNTQTGQIEYARLPGRQITVTGALPPPDASVSSAPLTETNNGVADAGEDNAAVAFEQPTDAWRWLSLALAIAWMATIVAWWRSRRTRRVIAAGEKAAGPASMKEVRTALKSACGANDKGGCRDALLRWSALRWPGNPATSLGDVGSRLSGDLQVEVHGLNRALYQSVQQRWSGEALWSAFVAQEKRPSRESSVTAEPRLAPLYRL